MSRKKNIIWFKTFFRFKKKYNISGLNTKRSQLKDFYFINFFYDLKKLI